MVGGNGLVVVKADVGWTDEVNGGRLRSKSGGDGGKK